MSIEVTRNFLLWCTVINYGLLVYWFLFIVLAHDWIQRLHGKWFRIRSEQFDAIHYAGMAIYKIAIVLFNVSPFVALCIVG